MGIVRSGSRGVAVCALLLAGALSAATPARAQAGDPLAPPPDLGASGLPVPGDGTAIAGPNTPPAGYMAIPEPPATCAGVVAVVRSQGFILIPIGNGDAQRYVRDERSCREDQTTAPAWISTPDNPRCYVGYTCIEAGND